MSPNDARLVSLSFSTFNRLILELQRLAQDQPLAGFHQHALQQLQALIAFDKAWWGRAAVVEGLPDEHSSYVFGLPAQYVADWQSIREQDPTVALTHAQPSRSVLVDSQAADSTPGLKWLARRHGFGQFLCIIHIDPQTQLRVHLTLYRAIGAPAFTDHERFLLDHLMPHLVAAEGANQIRALVALRETLDTPLTLALAVCDRFGTLHYAEHGFVQRLLLEWPQWSGPQLPTEVHPEGYRGRRVQLTSTQVGDLLLLCASPLPVLDQLSAREADVAERFGGGSTYKEIARELGLAPNTVRHHIRGIYAKLGVNSKAGIARHLHSPPL
ncbi:LuxR C-terminal-related transcriptional regulator [Pseudomonas sp. DTU_2021_1001937_2_SI_NGA_ILE_001]|uniref:helix-turn-helix transcriptional regulator n=1 Tax=Pseudomonas sp. DTU_2021_1001937_2_SI_NGA_ILE_001 TaxID=3077589 RepID=UPI0025DC9169|nr:LuxR C-terminal-related transcriptional regulator [Pseudomonas sp. DTU_2021_1001937_2_SI_NGA_ILE_001]WNW11847.1 LuxR C-terminal-related transcriptional regulator [Pseudomonas sp. DTU_2021_1001937_2_SI_NGA_ILE_001]